MNSANAAWRISDLVAYDSDVARTIGKIADLATSAEADSTMSEAEAIRAELSALTDGETP